MSQVQLINLSINDLKCLITDVLADWTGAVTTPAKDKQLIKGIHQLAAFLKVSPARAQKLKNEKIISCFQDGRLVLFNPETVLSEMAAYNEKKGRKNAK